MISRRAMRIPIASAAGLAAIRAWPGLEVCVERGQVYLSAATVDEALWERCRSIPGLERFTVCGESQLLPNDRLVPCGRLPTGPWEDFSRWLQIVLPDVEEASPPIPRTSLRLARSARERAADCLSIDLNAWTAYATQAPEMRLSRWSFAVSAAGRVLVRGRPLPPLPGEQLCDLSGLLVPLGFEWTPNVDPATVRAILRLDPGECALWSVDGSWQRLAADAWVMADRSAVRLTQAGRALQ